MDVFGHDKVVEKRPCSKCRMGGGDRTGDNEVVYADGHTHCFGCGRHSEPTILQKLEKLSEENSLQLDPREAEALEFPDDFTPIGDALWAKGAYAWLKNYGITTKEMEIHHIGWSSSLGMLIFPVFSDSGHLLMWQGRNFNGSPKYLTKGPKSDIMHIIGDQKSPVILVVEDLISAIKVGRTYAAMPLWGCSMTLGTLRKLSERFKEVGIWLDSNKAIESVKLALRGSQWGSTFVVTTESDPKIYSDGMIRAHVTDGRLNDFDPPEEPPKEPLVHVLADGTKNYIDPETGAILRTESPKRIAPDPQDVDFRWPDDARGERETEVTDSPFSWEARPDPSILHVRTEYEEYMRAVRRTQGRDPDGYGKDAGGS